MENRKTLLYKNHKDKIIPGEKSVGELLNFLKGEVDFAEIPDTELNQTVYQSIRCSFLHCVRNNELNLVINEFDIFICRIVKNSKRNILPTHISRLF